MSSLLIVCLFQKKNCSIRYLPEVHWGSEVTGPRGRQKRWPHPGGGQRRLMAKAAPHWLQARPLPPGNCRELLTWTPNGVQGSAWHKGDVQEKSSSFLLLSIISTEGGVRSQSLCSFLLCAPAGAVKYPQGCDQGHEEPARTEALPRWVLFLYFQMNHQQTFLLVKQKNEIKAIFSLRYTATSSICSYTVIHNGGKCLLHESECSRYKILPASIGNECSAGWGIFQFDKGIPLLIWKWH